MLLPGDDAVLPGGLVSPLQENKDVYYFAAELGDGSWAVFVGSGRYWGLSTAQRAGIWGLFLLLSFAAVSSLAMRQLSRPFQRFARSIRQTATSLHTMPIAVEGPRELRDIIAAFNEMQEQIREFITYRVVMLAAISHDLRTPLTRMRLRGEYIGDPRQQARLFRDVDEMRAMIDGALAFFRGDADEENRRSFDLAGILQSIADDFADQGTEIAYTGPDHFTYCGRPIALKRAFTNVIENAVKYGSPPEIDLSIREDRILVTVRDHGPGIPPESVDLVFKPFFRLDRSRNRSNGGVGLGLTATQAIVRGHGGEVSLHNRPSTGLDVVVSLPLFP